MVFFSVSPVHWTLASYSPLTDGREEKTPSSTPPDTSRRMTDPDKQKVLLDLMFQTSDQVDQDGELEALRAKMQDAVAAARVQSESSLAAIQADVEAETSRPKRLTFEMIMKRQTQLDQLSEDLVEEESKKAFQIRHLGLDRMNIGQIDNLELFHEVTHIYLQHNKIKVLEGFEENQKLRFLAVFSNLISEVQGTERIFVDA